MCFIGRIEHQYAEYVEITIHVLSTRNNFTQQRLENLSNDLSPSHTLFWGNPFITSLSIQIIHFCINKNNSAYGEIPFFDIFPIHTFSSRHSQTPINIFWGNPFRSDISTPTTTGKLLSVHERILDLPRPQKHSIGEIPPEFLITTSHSSPICENQFWGNPFSFQITTSHSSPICETNFGEIPFASSSPNTATPGAIPSLTFQQIVDGFEGFRSVTAGLTMQYYCNKYTTNAIPTFVLSSIVTNFQVFLHTHNSKRTLQP
jgi:hypothetical protein